MTEGNMGNDRLDRRIIRKLAQYVPSRVGKNAPSTPIPVIEAPVAPEVKRRERIDHYIRGHFADEVSKTTLRETLTMVNPGQRVALLGFSDLAKHVINNYDQNIVAVFDLDPRFRGFSFREQTVRHIGELDDFAGQIDVFLVCVYEQIVQFYDIVDQSAVRGVHMAWPEDFDGRLGHKYDVLHQSALYSYHDKIDRLGEPPTMMPRETITFLTELLRAALRAKGEIAEIGVWQGGSAWNMAKMMQALKDERPLHLFDFFDNHDRKNPEAIMCLDEIRSRFSFYSATSFYRGMANELMTQLADRTFCFVHIDLGFQGDVLEFFWNRMPSGAVMLMDNYGHVRASPGLFDAFFASQGHSVVRVPFSYQAFVMK
jgi:predicted O-methyltransferase YrrM